MNRSNDAVALRVLSALENRSVPISWPDVLPAFRRSEMCRWEAARLAGKRRMQEALPLLVKMLASQAPGDRISAADALRMLATRKAIPILTPLLSDHTGPVRLSAAAGLARLGVSDRRLDAVRAEIAKACSASNYQDRESAALDCGEFGDSWARARLRVLAGDPVSIVRDAALEGLAGGGR
jgi:HEAT repeat protein